MKFTLSWLKSHLDTSASVDEISAKLTSIGLEVDALHDPGKALGSFIVGHVLEADKHPNADRLKLCKVSTGTETLQVVCGAPNARAGLKVVLARPGDVIPESGEKLKKGKIRDVESQGMMCSTRELKLGEDHDGIIELPESAVVGAPVTTVLNIDPVFEINLTPNRVDALGVRGVARDLAAAGLGTLKPLNDGAVKGTFPASRNIAMRLPADQANKCPQFAGRTVKGVKNGPSPAWMQDRLKAIGLRSVSALVDITQYINIDLGRPIHAFDDAKLKGDVGPRLANDGEEVLALNGKTYKLDNSMVVIADDTAAVGIGGIMGGEPTSVGDGTTTIFIESAWFDPSNIASTGRKLEINSDARYCFERGVDIASAIQGVELTTRMVIDLCGGEASELVVGGQAPAPFKAVAFDPERVAKLGGVTVPVAEIKNILERLGFKVHVGSPWQVTPPSWRSDVTLWQDLVEEVLRIYGYDNIKAEPMPRAVPQKPALNAKQRLVSNVRRTLATRGLAETVTWSFLSKAHAELFANGGALVPLANPISADLDILRPSVVPNLIAGAGRNAVRGLHDSNLFEIGPRFEGFKPGEQMLMAAGVRSGHTSPRHWAGTRRPVDAMDAKADAIAALEAAGVSASGLQTGVGPKDGTPEWLHPGRSGTLKQGNLVFAWFGEIHPRVLQALDVKGPVVAFEVAIDRIPEAKKGKSGTARSLLKASPYQPVERDFAFVTDTTVSAETVLKAVRNAERDLVTNIGLFDVYEGPNVGEGKKSVAITVTLQSKDATLTDDQIEAVAKKIVAAVEKVGGQLRG